MHLLAAKPGGFVDEEGIVDLGQDTADIVILSAADSQLAALSEGLALFTSRPDRANLPSVRLANWMQLVKPAAYDLYEDKVLEQAKVVVVSLLGGKNYWPYGVERLVAWSKAKPNRHLLLVPGDDSPDPQLAADSNVEAIALQMCWRFLRESGAVNSQSLLAYLAVNFFGLALSWLPPQVLPSCFIYWPRQPLAELNFTQWQQLSGQFRSVVALVFYRSHLQAANSEMFDQLIELLQQSGCKVLPLVVTSLKDAASLKQVNAWLSQAKVQLMLNTTGFANNTVTSPSLTASPNEFEPVFDVKVPILQLVLASTTAEDWHASSLGLRSRDLAMQVVLPEMDGKILSRAVSFKSESHYDPRGQISVIRYLLHHERAKFVAQLAKAYCQLTQKPNHEKRIALILANYPTKDGRIGNGVGLDTPASTVNVMRALKQAGYPLGDLPEQGNALIETLLGAVTNNPNTLHSLGCWQSISVVDYQRHFSRLPLVSQQAVLNRWGAPEQDIKYRQGRLMISGYRCGETFIGIQPARGFNIDLAANYHDPDLVPPHNYLAFYFWLRHEYQIDAIIHVGKHGNLEWLPGKGSALADTCWPDCILGPLPHFYPFIVNDPGEGSQAKRRTQGVIIDHLMPPLTRAETYGELTELEGLVDEYYQAMGMDVRRETWLRQAIIEQLKTTHILDELAQVAGAGDLTDLDYQDQVFAELDTYLCDIKEAQIRHGLHILGELPEPEKVANTLVALLRLPTGSGHQSRGILHNLVLDFELRQGGALFDPLSAGCTPWSDIKPAPLQQVSKQVWRSCADTRERLELLALAWVKRYVLGSAELAELNDYPATQALLTYAKTVVKTALEKSVEQEINALLQGLHGEFIAPGPSGAPSRGRLDTLPTGRNFFSLDNRAIPSKAAWAIGEKSAQALLTRHLQEHGDYPRQLGLSVWGTATMRTGGDDIAQAFALMGIKPIWANGSHRVVDFLVIPCMQLGRPRVDVTLRVSGFFRDAFANVIKLFDAAVLAIAAIEEPGNGNLIQQNIATRAQQLVAQGMSESEAQRQASYRVFGSKPGAYGAGLQGLIDERCWEQASDLADAYLNWGGYAYGQDGEGKLAQGAFRHQLSQLEVVVHNQDNREHDLLDSDDYYQFQGGMSNAVSCFSGQAPTIYHSDHANPEQPVIRTLKEELNRVIRSRVLNPKWIQGMQQHGYKGAFEMSASIDYLFAYDATTGLIADYQYQQVTDTLLFEPQNRAFLQQNNPHALSEMAERLLEAIQRGLWQDADEYRERLQDLLLECDEAQELVR
ncbi:cobaltochelatase subunit CobN [Motilimonas cestriensis]|uniref:cobaltochelatase subunit CobN n=1 Tax=Motilimonas cestriensis TaxID=2742685 RepID=UPI003DA2D0A2